MTHRTTHRTGLALCLACAGLHTTSLAALRDPTEPPPVAQAAMAASSAGSSASAADAGRSPAPRHIVVSNGRSHVVERGRRFGVGDMLGQARIERITSDAIWLREGGSTRRVPLYAGVTKRPAVETSPAPSTSAPSPAASAPVVVKRLARSDSPLKEAP